MLTKEELDDYIGMRQYRQVNSVLVWQDEKILLERYYNRFDTRTGNVMRSVVKSIISVATGICLDQGNIKSLDEPIYRYLDEFAQGIHPYHKAITIRHLLSMSSGIYWVGGVHYHCPQLSLLRSSSDWVTFIAQTDIVHVPGTKYNYSEFDVILLSAVLQEAIQGDLFDYIQKYLYKPLGIQSGPWWKSRCGIPYSCANAGAGNGEPEERTSNLTAREMLRIGQLFLQNGSYQDRQIVSADYVKQAVTPLKQNPGYGYLWWLGQTIAGEKWYGCRGFGGQNITVIPEKKRIIVIQATPTARGMAYDDLWQNLV